MNGSTRCGRGYGRGSSRRGAAGAHFAAARVGAPADLLGLDDRLGRGLRDGSAVREGVVIRRTGDVGARECREGSGEDDEGLGEVHDLSGEEGAEVLGRGWC